MLYFLLAIIAIGVLLASEEGKKTLSVLTVLALLAGGGYLLFWVFLFIYAWYSSWSEDSKIAIVSLLFLIPVFLCFAFFEEKILQKSNTYLSFKQLIAKFFSAKYLTNCFAILMVSSLLFLTVFFIYALIFIDQPAP